MRQIKKPINNETVFLHLNSLIMARVFMNTQQKATTVSKTKYPKLIR